jgi:hypothetical protein
MEGFEAPEWRAPWRSATLQTRRSETLTIAGTAIRLRSVRQSPPRRPGAGNRSQIDEPFILADRALDAA